MGVKVLMNRYECNHFFEMLRNFYLVVSCMMEVECTLWSDFKGERWPSFFSLSIKCSIWLVRLFIPINNFDLKVWLNGSTIFSIYIYTHMCVCVCAYKYDWDNRTRGLRNVKLMIDHICYQSFQHIPYDIIIKGKSQNLSHIPYVSTLFIVII